MCVFLLLMHTELLLNKNLDLLSLLSIITYDDL